MPTKIIPIHSLPRKERREAAEKFAGLRCIIEVHPYRDNDSEHNHTITGRILGVAVPNTGTVADQLVVKVDDPRKYLQSLSLATVYSIEVL